MTAPSLMPVPGAVTAGSVTPGGLGTVQLYLGILAPIPERRSGESRDISGGRSNWSDRAGTGAQ